MEQKFIEVSDQANWAKILVGKFARADLEIRSKVEPGRPLLEAVASKRRISTGDPLEKIFILDLQTEEGAFFWLRPGGDAKQDLELHEIWVCPLFLPFLQWFYAWAAGENKMNSERWKVVISKLPSLIELPPSDDVKLQGWRRPGPEFQVIAQLRDMLVERLKITARLPETLTQVMIFMMEQAEKAAPLLQQYLSTLTDRDKNRWIGALMADSGRYVSVPTTHAVAMIPKKDMPRKYGRDEPLPPSPTYSRQMEEERKKECPRGCVCCRGGDGPCCPNKCCKKR